MFHNLYDGRQYIDDDDFDAAFDWDWRNYDVLHYQNAAALSPSALTHYALALNHNSDDDYDDADHSYDYAEPIHFLPLHHHHHYHRQQQSPSWPYVQLFYGDLIKSNRFRRGRAIRDYLRATRRPQQYHQAVTDKGPAHQKHDSRISFIVSVPSY